MWNGKKNFGMKKTQSTDNSGPQQLNLTEIIRKRIGGRKGKLIPGFLLRSLERLIRQKELNQMLRIAYPAKGSEFSRRILKHLCISLSVKGLDRLPDGKAYIFASNHPLGGLDGISLVAILGEKYGDKNLRVMVNDLLMNVEPLSGVFLPVNKFGSQGRESSRLLNAALEDGKQIVMFPAGLVSRLHKDGSINDLEWQKSFVSKAIEFKREIVPVRFEGKNSMKFYKTARLRKRLGLKINVEQALLPSEVCKSQGKSFVVTFGKPINPETYRKAGKSPKEIAAGIREAVCGLDKVEDGKIKGE